MPPASITRAIVGGTEAWTNGVRVTCHVACVFQGFYMVELPFKTARKGSLSLATEQTQKPLRDRWIITHFFFFFFALKNNYYSFVFGSLHNFV